MWGNTAEEARGRARPHQDLPPWSSDPACHCADNSTLRKTAASSSHPKAASTKERNVSSVPWLFEISTHNLDKWSVLSAYQDLG